MSIITSLKNRTSLFILIVALVLDRVTGLSAPMAVILVSLLLYDLVLRRQDFLTKTFEAQKDNAILNINTRLDKLTQASETVGNVLTQLVQIITKGRS